MSTSIDQKAYLQRYLGGPSKEKKKKKKKAIKGKGFKIIDDDIDLSKLRPLDGDELDILDEGEDAPQIAGIVDERPEELKKLEQFKTSSKWRVINQDDGFNSQLQIEEIKKDVKETEKENEIIFGKMYSDSEDEKQKNDSDVSPPRKNSKKHSNDSDFSPPRKSEPSPRKETKYDSDVSPPRKQDIRKERARKPSRWGDADPEYNTNTSPRTHNSNSNRSPGFDLSPQRRRKYDSDESPPRKKKSNRNAKSNKSRSSSSDLSPPRRNNTQSDSKEVKCMKSSERNYKVDRETSGRDKDSRNRKPDRDRRDRENSPNDRNNKKRKDSDSLSPLRREKDRNEYSNEKDKSTSNKSHCSPKNHKRIYNSDSDLSPPRKDRDRKISKNNRTSRISPTPKHSRRKHDSDSDLSPPRKGKDRNVSERDRIVSDRDRNISERDRNKQRRDSDSPPPTNKKMAKTLEGKMAGLQDARQLRQENEEFRRKENEVFKKLADDVSGRNAKAVSRKGKRDTSEDRQKKKEKAERQKELDAKYKMWSKGLKQIEDQEARTQHFLHEASKPVARHKDDKDLERSLKQVQRDGDPMLQYIMERKRERGEIEPEKPSYKGSFPPNRFNIRPGYRWDGVDRSNGYEQKYFLQQSKKKAQEEEAYKWSTEDL